MRQFIGRLRRGLFGNRLGGIGLGLARVLVGLGETFLGVLRAVLSWCLIFAVSV